MKKIIYSILSFSLIWLVACEQVPIEVEPPVVVTIPTCPSDATAGTASFTKFVAIGNSFVAGTQAGALFNISQANSLPRILAKQFECVGGSTTFNQPDIGSVNGYNIQSSIPGVITLGRNILFDPDGPTGPRSAAPYPSGYPGAAATTCPSAVSATPPLPAPYNTADLPSAFGGNKATLQNFGVPFIVLAQALIPQTGGPPSATPPYNGLYARFASNPGTSTILSDAITAQGSFYLVWLGMDDVLLWAAGGADESGSVPALATKATFEGQYNSLIGALLDPTLGIPATSKAVVGNIPNITTLPYFYTVPWNTIVIDEATQASLTTNLATPYNAFLEAMDANDIITPEEKAKRLLTYVAGKNANNVILKDANGVQYKNGVLLTDQTLTDLSPYMTGNAAALMPYAMARQATATDLIPLTAGAVLGTCLGGNPLAVQGVSYPVGDKYAITSAELTIILTRTAEFNAAISTQIASNADRSARLALANVNTAYSAFVTAKAGVANNVTITPSFAPPTGAFSEDGIHPNTRGYAYTANIFIDAINAKFGSKIPKASYAAYSGTGLPVNP
jgi:hypothetical protein